MSKCAGVLPFPLDFSHRITHGRLQGCGGQNNASPGRCPCANPQNLSVNFYSKGDVKLKIWDREVILDCSGGSSVITKDPKSGRGRQKRRSERWHVRRGHPAFGGFENGGKRPSAKEWGPPLQAEKGKETDSPLRSFQKERNPADTIILVQWDVSDSWSTELFDDKYMLF